MSDPLIDRIYEAAAVPELWAEILQEVAESSGSFGGLLFVLRDAKTRWVASPGARSLWDGFVSGGWLENNSRATRLLNFNHAGWVHDLDLFTREELDREPVYTEYFRKVGAGWGAGTAIELPDGDSIFFTMERSFSTGPFQAREIDRLDGLRPHLSRAAYLSMRLSMAHAQTTAAALGAVGIAAAVVRANGRLMAANEQMERLIPDVFLDSRERISLVDRHADQLLAEAIEQLSVSGVAEVASIPVRSKYQGAPGLVVQVLPVRRAARDIFTDSAFIVITNIVGAHASPRASLLTALFDLSPAEARIARAIADLKTPEEIAVEYRISRETIRSHIRSIYSKTGLSSRAGLAHLVGAVGAAASR